MKSMIDPDCQFVRRVLHVVDPCDVCSGRQLYTVGRNGCRQVKCSACSGHGKALHPDRVVGALRRFMAAVLGGAPMGEVPCGEGRMEFDTQGHSSWAAGDEMGRVRAYCAEAAEFADLVRGSKDPCRDIGPAIEAHQVESFAREIPGLS